LAHLMVTVNTQRQTCLRGKEQTFPKLNFHDNLHQRSGSEYHMHLLVTLRDQFFILPPLYILLILFTVTCKFI
jgi:hypothetical protein